MNDIFRGIGRGFTGIVRFRGRFARGQFWPYAGLVFLLSQIPIAAAMVPLFARFQRYAIEHPEQSRIVSGPGQYRIEIEGHPPELGGAFAAMAPAVAIGAAVAVLLLAAAVARRLHDTGRSGLWGLLPLPFLAAALVLMRRLFASLARPEPDMTLFFALFVNNLLYLASLALLVFLLAAPATAGPNRYGPPAD